MYNEGVYNFYPTQRHNKKLSFLSRFYRSNKLNHKLVTTIKPYCFNLKGNKYIYIYKLYKLYIIRIDEEKIYSKKRLYVLFTMSTKVS